MNPEPQLHTAVVSMISLAASIAAKHPSMGLCQVERLRGLGVPPHQIDAVIEIARHIRDEAGQKLDAAFDDSLGAGSTPAEPETADGACCSATRGGQSCC